MRKIVLIIPALLAACAQVPPTQPPAIATAAAWSEKDAPKAGPVTPEWWKTFDSKELNGLMDKALSQNTDIRAAIQRVAQARANLDISGSSLLPAVDANAGDSWNRNSRTTSRNSWDAGVGVSYELDLFGANRAGVASARAALEGSGFDKDAISLIVMAETAKAYFTVASLRERAALAADNLKSATEVLNIADARFKAGTSSALDVARQKTARANIQATLSTLKRQQANAENALAVLAGQAPRTLKVDRARLTNLKNPSIAAGQPSTLAVRRPDIQAAEATLAAANADIGAARAAFFPRITLGANLGLAGGPTAAVTTLAAALVAPIFSGGALEGGVKRAEARQLELVEDYRKTVLTALQEVEDALAATKAAQERQSSLAVALKEAQGAYDLSRQQYDAGAIDFETLLDSQTDVNNARDAYAQISLEKLAAAVDLYKALGGGWKK